MKRFGALPTSLLTLSFLLALAVPAAHAAKPHHPRAQAPAGEHRMTAAELRDLAHRDVLWCDGYEAATDDCEQITLMQVRKDGILTQTTTLLLEEQPRMQAFLGELDKFVGDKLCSVIDSHDLPAGFLLEGHVVQEPNASTLRQALIETLVDLHGKTVCQAFYRGPDPNRVREVITVDGKRREDLESLYILREGARGFALRAAPPEKAPGTKI
jgi:hypothetical protein